MNVLIDQEVIEKNFVTIPYTHGLSFDYKDSSNYVKINYNIAYNHDF